MKENKEEIMKIIYLLFCTWNKNKIPGTVKENRYT